jgi:hypothetical protein
VYCVITPACFRVTSEGLRHKETTKDRVVLIERATQCEKGAPQYGDTLPPTSFATARVSSIVCREDIGQGCQSLMEPAAL